MFRKILVLERSRPDSKIIVDADDFGHPDRAAFIRGTYRPYAATLYQPLELQGEKESLPDFVDRCYAKYALRDQIDEVAALLAKLPPDDMEPLIRLFRD